MTSDAPFQFNRMTFENQEAFVRSGRRCATPIPNDFQITHIADSLRAYRQAGAREVETATINVQFIHIVSGNDGKITEQQRVDQIAVLNGAYNQHGITFEHDEAAVMEVNKPQWFHMGYGSQAERSAKNALHVDPLRNLNFYTADLQDSLLGWATFPADLAGDLNRDGVVLLHSSLPGGSSVPYNLGDTATHEVGHWLGLYHTFEPRGTCDPFDDRVDDTVAHMNPDFGTPGPGVYSACDGVSLSPVKNYMNYTDDSWMDHFTLGQGGRMRDQIGLYRPGLVSEAPEPDSQLVLSAVATGNLSGTGQELVFSVNLPTNTTITLDGPGGVDFDLYVRLNQAPTTTEYDQRSYSAGPDESLQVTPTSPGLYFIMVRSYSGSGNFELRVALD